MVPEIRFEELRASILLLRGDTILILRTLELLFARPCVTRCAREVRTLSRSAVLSVDV